MQQQAQPNLPVQGIKLTHLSHVRMVLDGEVVGLHDDVSEEPSGGDVVELHDLTHVSQKPLLDPREYKMFRSDK